jgi:urease accessory protein
VSVGRVANAADLAQWLIDLCEHGSARNDLAFVALSWDAASAGRQAELCELADLAAAMQPSAERRLETLTQGSSFVSAIRTSWACRVLDDLAAARPGAVPYPVALGTAAAAHGQPRPATLSAFGLAFVSNLVSAALRLSLIGQTEGQQVLARLAPVVATAAQWAATAAARDIASATYVSDIASMAHETSQARLFRS